MSKKTFSMKNSGFEQSRKKALPDRESAGEEYRLLTVRKKQFGEHNSRFSGNRCLMGAMDFAGEILRSNGHLLDFRDG